MANLPVSVLIITKNAGAHLDECLQALKPFDEVVVIDSHSTDQTRAIAERHKRPIIDFTWNGDYPKKKQWSLENVPTKHDWVMMVDADEIVTPALVNEITSVLKDPKHFAYFIAGQPVFCGALLNHGRWNNKIALFDKRVTSFPQLNDDGIKQISEIEYHYQPQVKGTIGRLKHHLVHYCADNMDEWNTKHARYAQWQGWIEAHNIDLGRSEQGLRKWMKRIFRRLPFRGAIIFCDCFFAKQGFFDGKNGYRFARARMLYYAQVEKIRRAISNKASDISV